MKPYSKIVLPLVLTASAAAAPVGPMYLTPTTVAVSPGDFNVTNTDVAKLISQQMSEHFARQRDDKEFFVRSINEIESSANKMNSEIVIGQLQFASQKSGLLAYENPHRTGGRSSDVGAINVEQFFTMMNQYNASKQVLENKIKGIQTMAKGALPSASAMVTEKKDVTLPSHLNLDFDKIASYYSNRLKEMDSTVSSLGFKIKDKAGLVHDVSGFNVDPKKMAILNEEERNTRQQEINRLRSSVRTLENKQDQYTVMTRDLVQTHLTNFGTSERMRMLNDKDIAARKKDYERLAEVFWARSYLRQQYGIPLGTIGAEYKKRFMSIEEFLSNPSKFVDLSKVPYRSKKDLLRAEESYRNSAAVIEKKAASVFDGNFSLLARANSLLTKATGWGPMAESSEMVLRLLAADAAEELMLMEPGGQQKARDFFKNRYMSDATSRASTFKLLCAYDPSGQPAGKCPSQSTATTIDQDRRTGGDPTTMFRDLVRQSNLQLSSYQQARQLQDQLDSMVNLEANPLNQAIRRGNESLWGDATEQASGSKPGAGKPSLQ
jgi:hypothetical protein